MIWLLIPLAIISGILGRMGGANGWNTKYRDIGCSLIFTLSAVLFIGKASQYWWAYCLTFGLMWGALSTYFQRLFHGKDNFTFSGGMVGLAACPLLFIDLSLWWVVTLRSVILAGSWWLIHTYRRPVWKWSEDVVEEFLRYFVSL